MAVMDFIQNTFEKFGRSNARIPGGKGIGNNMGMAEYDDVRLPAPGVSIAAPRFPLLNHTIADALFSSFSSFTTGYLHFWASVVRQAYYFAFTASAGQ